jgi:PEP-CTERM motif
MTVTQAWMRFCRRGGALLTIALAAPPAAQAALLEGCSAISTCTAALSSGAGAVTQYNFTAIQGGYRLPTNLAPGQNTFSDLKAGQSAAALHTEVGVLGANQATDNSFYSTALADVQTGYGVNRGAGFTTVGTSGVDDRGTQSSHVDVRTSATALSIWRDVWSFTGNGHFSASLALDGSSRRLIDNVLFPSSFVRDPRELDLGNWNYSLEVWNLDQLAPDPDGLLAPTFVAGVEAIGADERRSSFASMLALDFDFVAGESYYVRSRLEVFTRDGRSIDMFNTVRLQDIVLSPAAQWNTLSGHDYRGAVVGQVPEPSSAGLIAVGLLAMAGGFGRRRRR